MKMAVSNVEVTIFGSSLQFQWELLMPEARALSIQLATDSNFTRNYNHFIIPTGASSVRLEVGAGEWYFRMGTWSGKDHVGDVTWTATYGPARVVTAKPTLASPPANVSILHSFAIPEGIHFNSNIGSKSIICVEICKNSSGFEANNTTMKYYLDWGNGGFDIRGLDSANNYALRVTKFPFSSVQEFPKDTLIHMPAGAIVPLRRPIRTGRHGDGDRMAAARGGEAMLREAAERPTMKFPSQAAYLRFLASKTSSQYH